MGLKSKNYIHAADVLADNADLKAKKLADPL